MEFNRLLSQVISFYGEPNKNKINKTEQPLKISEINTKLYKNILNEKDLEKLIKNLNEQSIISVDTETPIEPQIAFEPGSVGH